MSTTLEVRVPDIGDYKDIPVVEILVKAGDRVGIEQAVVTLESDKATLDVPTPAAGRVASVAVTEGTRVSQGSLILILDIERASEPQASTQPSVTASDSEVPRRGPVQSKPEEAQAPQRPQAVPMTAPSSPVANNTELAVSAARIYASPSTRRLARELGADLSSVAASGRGGRILFEDVQKSVRAVLQTRKGSLTNAADRGTPAVDFSKYGAIERRPLSRIQRVSGAVLARNWATIPHVTNFGEADVTDLDALRIVLNEELAGNPKLTMLSFLVKAAAVTLIAFPALNASLDGDELILKKYVHIGVAVDTPGGLVVPVIRNADQRGIVDIARELAEKSAAARAGKLKSSDLEGGCFTISSLGGIESTGFTPIINAPEIAILGAARAAIRPRYDGKTFQPRLVLPLALSWDHRAADGVAAARFLMHLATLLSDFRRVSL